MAWRRVPYITELLTEGLGLPESQISIGSGKEAWTLGAALAEGSRVLGSEAAIRLSQDAGGSSS